LLSFPRDRGEIEYERGKKKEGVFSLRKNDGKREGKKKGTDLRHGGTSKNFIYVEKHVRTSPMGKVNHGTVNWLGESDRGRGGGR